MMFSKNTNNATTNAAATSEKKSWKEKVASVAIPTVGIAAIGGAAAGIVHIVRGKRKAAEVIDDWKEDESDVQTEQPKPVDPQKEADRKAMESITAMLDIYEVADDETVLAAGNSFIAAGEAVCTEEFYERNWETNLKFFGRYERMVKKIRELQDADAKRETRFEVMYNALKIDLEACVAAVESTNVDTKLDDLKSILPLARKVREHISGDFGIYVMGKDTEVLNNALSIVDMVKSEIEFQERKQQRTNDIDVDTLAEKMNASAIPDELNINEDADVAADLAKDILREVVNSIVD